MKESLLIVGVGFFVLVTVVATVKYCQNNLSEEFGGKPQAQVAFVEAPLPIVSLNVASID